MTRRHLFALLAWMAGALCSFSLAAISIRFLAKTLNVSEMLAFRNFAGIVALVVIALARPELRSQFKLRRPLLHLIRNGVHFIGNYAWALSITLLPLATVFALEFTAPIWLALLAVIFLRERLTGPRLVAIAAGFIGVLIIVRPGAEGLKPAAFIMLAGALAFAATSIATKKLTATETTFSIIFWMNVIQLPLNLAGTRLEAFAQVHAQDLLPLAGLAIGGLTSHYCLTNAYRYGDATVVMPLDFLRIPLIAMLGWLIFGESLDLFVFAGAALIIGGIMWSLRAEAKRRPASVSAVPAK